MSDDDFANLFARGLKVAGRAFLRMPNVLLSSTEELIAETEAAMSPYRAELERKALLSCPIERAADMAILSRLAYSLNDPGIDFVSRALSRRSPTMLRNTYSFGQVVNSAAIDEKAAQYENAATIRAFYAECGGRYFVVFKGSTDTFDWMVNSLICHRASLTSGHHAGYFVLGALYWHEVLRNKIPRAGITFVGHSLGGAIATYAAWVAKKNRPESAIDLFTFGAPQVGKNGDPWETQVKAYEFAAVGDPVAGAGLYYENQRPRFVVREDGHIFLWDGSTEASLLVEFENLVSSWRRGHVPSGSEKNIRFILATMKEALLNHNEDDLYSIQDIGRMASLMGGVARHDIDHYCSIIAAAAVPDRT